KTGLLIAVTVPHNSGKCCICQQLDIQPWNEKIIRNFITKRLSPTSIIFTEADINEIIQKSGRNPQKVTQFCYQKYSQYLENES
ncbi:hypothetical protein VB713_16725, partial [Anabaena cylindrica UHCC 0172]|uniref:hypothetical protein n=1 Tax=Anabaena cylindrica TaxID=1165 RepID=UPI002B3BC5D4|nr:hypothetical protein [Anabaena cylindrica UHCC 0172]